MPIQRRFSSGTDQPKHPPEPAEAVNGVHKEIDNLGPPVPDDAVTSVGRLVYGGMHPNDVPVKDLLRLIRFNYNGRYSQWGRLEQRYRDRIKNRATGVRAFCITCAGGPKAVSFCINTHCPLWAYRLGKDPFRNRAKLRRPRL
jgi:hypothetical protein